MTWLHGTGAAAAHAPHLAPLNGPPVDSASGLVLDIDGGETFTIRAFDASDNLLEESIITDGDPGTGSRRATPWWFSRDTPDVVSIRFSGVRPSGIFGLGFDNFTTCAPTRLP